MNIRNLVFFKSDGRQIPVQYDDKLTFTILFEKYDSAEKCGWLKESSGYCEINEKNEIFSFVVTDGGSSFGIELSHIEKHPEINFEESLKNLIKSVKIATKNVQIFKFDRNDDEDLLTDNFDFELGIRKVSVRNSEDESDNIVYEYYIKRVILLNKDFVNETIDENERTYPGVQLLGTISMEPVSTDLVSSESIFVLEKIENLDGEIEYVRPFSYNQQLYFSFNEESDTKFVKYRDEYIEQDAEEGEKQDDVSKVYWSKFYNYDLMSEFGTFERVDEPLILHLGFKNEQEGCFQDVMTLMTIDDIANDSTNSISYNGFGYFTIKNETIGEDERYRTLFGNFGIPDPKNYNHIFKESELYEEDVDWKFVNKKSKELFLTYQEIFPYVGTYKALINAVKFLGYEDIIFKEWYKSLTDEDGNNKISYNSIDIALGQVLESKLKRYGISLNEFLKWNKMNQLSMMYLINKEESLFDTVTVKDNETGLKKYEKTFNIPTTTPNYEYFNLEVLTKIYALRDWLQKYILNINCKIIDVTGEGVYFERYKHQINPSGPYQIFDFKMEEFLTPVIKFTIDSTEMKQSQCSVLCTIEEISKGLKYEHLGNKTIEDYIQHIFDLGTIDKSNFENDESDIIKNLVTYISGKDLFDLTPFEHIQYELVTDVSTGSLKRGVGVKDGSAFRECPLMVDDDKIFMYGYLEPEVEFTELPIIHIKSGNLRSTFGKWNKYDSEKDDFVDGNVLYKIKGYFDTDRTKTRFCIQDNKGTVQSLSDDYITLYPKKNATFKYTNKNKYDVPMFIIDGYDTFDDFLVRTNKTEKFVLEIYEGFISKQEDSFNDNGTLCYSELHFEPTYDVKNINAQKVYLRYRYQTPMMIMKELFRDDFEDEVKTLFEEYFDKISIVDTKIEDLSKLTIDDLNSEDVNKELDIFEDGQLTRLDEMETIEMYDEIRKEYIDKINDLKIQQIQHMDDDLYQVYQMNIDNVQEKLDKIQLQKSEDENNKLVFFESLKEKWNHVYETQKQNLEMEFLQQVENLKSEKITTNFSTVINVNHIGEYKLFVKAIDGYNIPYVQKSKNSIKITASTPEVFVCDTQERDIIKRSIDVKKDLDVKPYFVPEYERYINKIYEVNDEYLSENMIDYLNFSYYFDIPKKDDNIKFINCTEKIDEVVLDWGSKDEYNLIKVVLNDEMSGYQNVFYKGAEVWIYILDKNSMDIAPVSNSQIGYGPYYVVEYNPIPENISIEPNENYLILGYKTEDVMNITNDIISEILNKNVFARLINSTMLDLEPDEIENTVSEDGEPICFIRIKDRKNGRNQVFSKGQKVKILYSEVTFQNINEENSTSEKYLSGTTYTILDSGYDYSNFCQKYVLNGWVNTGLIEPRLYKNGVYNHLSDIAEKNLFNVPYTVKLRLAPAHQTYVAYDSKCIEEGMVQKSIGSFEFDNSLFLKDYLDNTFVFVKRDFDTRDAFDDWYVARNAITQMNTQPIIRNVEDEIVVTSEDTREVFKDCEYMSVWEVKWNPLNRISENRLLYRLINDNLSLKPVNKGEYQFGLIAYDKFGNKRKNNSQGFVEFI